MENAADALKMAFAMLIFVIALSISISVYTQARSTADAVFYMTDITNFYDNVEAGETHRTVGMETIIPAIYRYALEDYAVTLVNKDGTVIARYSTATDSAVANWREYITYALFDSTDISVKNNSEKARAFLEEMSAICDVLDRVYNISKKDVLKEYAVKKQEFEKDIERIDNAENIEYKEVDSLIKCYTNNNTSSKINGYIDYSCWWNGNNTDIIERIDRDISGVNKIRGYKNRIPCDIYEGIGLLEEEPYKGATFTEYVFEVKNDVLISEDELRSQGYTQDEIDIINANGENKFLKSHLEVVYVQN